ncbi:MFS transporter [Jeotgalibaca ciconiae]|uniref:MFS transporter n=1 Tax=Jeotgalibaca ciconiae TaxID=2496265 RepID=A0A3S9HAS9_9LACT|nr:MFS transporter [Jeotgalibaca ciconiae]AZP04492.1 MFS transporter [Jeotgalibaca ciconiae]HJB24380.1 MFS transporter [Candidatus Jeotgalibaca pullicola]
MKNESFYTRLNADEKYIMKCVYYVFAVNGLYGMIMGSLLPYISEAYNLSDTVSGSLLSSHYVGNLLASFIAGILPIYLGRKKAIIFLSSFVTAGFLLMITTGNPFLLILSFFFTGLSRGSISNFNNSIVNEISNSSSAALSFLHSIFAIGALLAPYLVIGAVHLIGVNGWRLAGVVIIILTALSIFFFSRMKMPEEPVERKKKVVSYDFMKKKTFWILAGTLFFYLCGESTINGWLVKYFVDSGILTIGYSQFLASLLWVGVLLGRLAVSAIGDRFPRIYVLYALTLTTTLFFVVLLASRNQMMITFAILGLGLSMAGIYPTTIAATGGFIKDYPMAMGILLVLGGIGSIVMPTITGALSDQFGIFYGMAAIGVALGLMILCVFLYDRDQKAKAS